MPRSMKQRHPRKAGSAHPGNLTYSVHVESSFGQPPLEEHSVANYFVKATSKEAARSSAVKIHKKKFPGSSVYGASDPAVVHDDTVYEEY